MGNIKAKLLVEGQERELLWVNMDYNRPVQPHGKPDGEVQGGFIAVAFTTHKDDDYFLSWMFKERKNIPYAVKDIEVAFYEHSFDDAPYFRYRGIDAVPVFHRETFSNTEGMYTTLVFSPAVQHYKQQREPFLKRWQESWKPQEEVKKNVKEDKSPRIFSVKWTDTDKNEIEESFYKDKVGIKVELLNQIKGRVNLKITKKDGSKFEDDKSEITLNKSVLSDTVFFSQIELKERWEEFKKTDVEDELIVEAHYLDDSKQSQPLKITPTPKVLVNFRPHNGWKGEFGFDWIRMEDTGRKGDVWYKKIIGKYAASAFVQNDAEYAKLGNKFEMLTHPIKANDMYVVPVLSLLPNKIAKLSLKVEIKDNDAKKIEFRYNSDYFKLNQTEVSYKSVGKETLPDYLTIESIKEFGENQFIEVFADNKFAGKLKVVANDKKHRYKTKIVFVKVRIDIGNGISAGKTIGEERFLKRFLTQAQISANIIEKELDLTKDKVFIDKYTFNYQGIDIIKDVHGIHSYLSDQFDKVYSGFKNHFKVYFFNEMGGEIRRHNGVNHYQGYNGSAEKIDCRDVLLYSTHNTSTTTHELLHAMRLYHTFDNKSELTFEKEKTDNIMDYSHNAGIDRICLWQWQWDRIHGHSLIKKEK